MASSDVKMQLGRALALGLVLAGWLAACGGSDTPNPSGSSGAAGAAAGGNPSSGGSGTGAVGGNSNGASSSGASAAGGSAGTGANPGGGTAGMAGTAGINSGGTGGLLGKLCTKAADCDKPTEEWCKPVVGASPAEFRCERRDAQPALRFDTDIYPILQNYSCGACHNGTTVPSNFSEFPGAVYTTVLAQGTACTLSPVPTCVDEPLKSQLYTKPLQDADGHPTADFEGPTNPEALKILTWVAQGALRGTPAPVCGNSIKEDGEECDAGLDPNLVCPGGQQTCGKLCNGNCQLQDGLPGDCTEKEPWETTGCLVQNKFAIFVSGTTGNDSTGDGTKETPFASITAGVAAAAGTGKRVFVCADTNYSDTVIDGSASGLAIYGGFACPGGVWTWSDSTRAKIVASAPGVIPFRVSGIGSTGLRIRNFDVSALDAVTTGQSSIAGLVANSSKVSIDDSIFTAGTAQNGANGASHRSNAATGVAGLPAASPTTCASRTSDSPISGASQTCAAGGTTAGGNGAGFAKLCFPLATCSTLPLPGGTGTPVPDPAGTGLGAPHSTTCGSPTNGKPGSAGGLGSGAIGTGSLSASGWSGVDGASGDPGQPGQGGGGGGRDTDKGCALGSGVGASGGSGGCGGLGGNGGKAGGSSIALVSVSSSVTLTKTTLTAKNAGNGGDGATGQVGGAGGPGGKAGTGVYGGCAAAAGGAGGQGGPGGGGQGGHSIALAYTGGTPLFDKSVGLMPGNAGKGGRAGNLSTTAPGAGQNGIKAASYGGPWESGDANAPTGGVATSVTNPSASSLVINFTQASDDKSAASLISYNICWSTSTTGCTSSFTSKATVVGSPLNYTATGLSANTPYYFVVRAEDTSGNRSTNTTQVSGTTLPSIGTISPTGSCGSAAGKSQIAISFSTSGSAASTYRTCRILGSSQASSGCGWSASTTSTSATFTSLNPNAAYTIWVEATNAGGTVTKSLNTTTPSTYSNVSSLIGTGSACAACHGSEGFSRAELVNITSKYCSSKLVVAGNAGSSDLISRLTATSGGSTTCGGAMPPGRTTAFTGLSTVTDWVNDGACP